MFFLFIFCTIINTNMLSLSIQPFFYSRFNDFFFLISLPSRGRYYVWGDTESATPNHSSAATGTSSLHQSSDIAYFLLIPTRFFFPHRKFFLAKVRNFRPVDKVVVHGIDGNYTIRMYFSFSPSPPPFLFSSYLPSPLFDFDRSRLSVFDFGFECRVKHAGFWKSDLEFIENTGASLRHLLLLQKNTIDFSFMRSTLTFCSYYNICRERGFRWLRQQWRDGACSERFGFGCGGREILRTGYTTTIRIIPAYDVTFDLLIRPFYNIILLQATWSPHADQIVIARFRPLSHKSELLIYNVLENRLSVNVDTSQHPFYFYWSPDNTQLSFLSNWAPYP